MPYQSSPEILGNRSAATLATPFVRIDFGEMKAQQGRAWDESLFDHEAPQPPEQTTPDPAHVSLSGLRGLIGSFTPKGARRRAEEYFSILPNAAEILQDRNDPRRKPGRPSSRGLERPLREVGKVSADPTDVDLIGTHRLIWGKAKPAVLAAREIPNPDFPRTYHARTGVRKLAARWDRVQYLRGQAKDLRASVIGFEDTRHGRRVLSRADKLDKKSGKIKENFDRIASGISLRGRLGNLVLIATGGKNTENSPTDSTNPSMETPLTTPLESSPILTDATNPEATPEETSRLNKLVERVRRLVKPETTAEKELRRRTFILVAAAGAAALGGAGIVTYHRQKHKS